MKRIFLFLIAMSIGMMAHAQFGFPARTKQVYTSPDLKKAMKNYKTIAILPVGTQLSFKSQVPYLNERNQAIENTGLANQSRLYSYILPKSHRMKVEIQDIEKTNLLLLKSEMSSRLDQYTKEEIAKILGVDAILSGLYESYAFIREGQMKIDTASLSIKMPGTSTVVKNTLTLVLYDGQTGKQMWRFYDHDEQYTYISDYLIEQAVRSLPFIR
ncbi:hypothetical protein SAMN05421820_107421 [Pedobacter steynii]|uniref:DUF4136 domain-containing protein n=1 Tax=Pedobacter steynii TaxID=430522 RepID=A0A1H0BIG9_9SPHI|nr:hypothetical protein [Pedobacter steynii]NQX41045.1 hypothetical protein [Pedobacter steynii]SDN45417.1 hypothetical protein SAMN05421820_107421 [Pedobacter steynii]